MHRVLIANRGEIALRILRACRELGLGVVAAYTKVDQAQLHLRHADDTVCIGQQSYLDINAMIAAATSRGCDAIHPGYGWLAENPAFAAATEAANLVFIGPTATTIADMADKAKARAIAASHGLDCVPGGQALVTDLSRAKQEAKRVGYPVLIKAAQGGGGRGIRKVDTESQMKFAIAAAGAEAEANFGSADLYLEKFLDRARHIEVQVLGDGGGRAIHLGTRECSIQRLHQKIIEEAPAAHIDQHLLNGIAEASARVTAALSYRNAGTFEYLYQDGQFYFIEMNTRIQVEHPVTEMVTGIDLVKAQIQIAMSGQLPCGQQEVAFSGHALECRINAESYDESTGTILPGAGLVRDLIFPGGPGIRVDSHLYNGYAVPHQFDSLVAKLIAFGPSRPVAIARMQGALAEFQVRGIDTNLALLRRVVADPRFATGDVTTRFLTSGQRKQ
jgi:acetyl-CoA carboxylase, biotin carboxylase subunit